MVTALLRPVQGGRLMAHTGGGPIRVVIVDDHVVVRLGLKTALGGLGDIRVIGEAGSIAEAIEAVQRDVPDVILMDVRLPDGSGVAALRRILADYPAVRVLMLTSYTDEEAVVGAVFGGAAGYLLKNIDPDGLLRAIRQVAAGQTVLDPSVTHEVLQRLRDGSSAKTEDTVDALSVQEHKVLALVSEGYSNKEISAELGLTEKTVRNYLYKLYKKMNVKRRSQAMRLYLKQHPA
jgi:two-component system, NarL family, response regulator DevR